MDRDCCRTAGRPRSSSPGDYFFGAAAGTIPGAAGPLGTAAIAGGAPPAAGGAAVTWEHITKSKEDLFPSNLDWNGSLPIAPMALPGKTPLAGGGV